MKYFMKYLKSFTTFFPAFRLSITNQHNCSQTTTGVTYWRHFTP